jgi:hypothetical protein
VLRIELVGLCGVTVVPSDSFLQGVDVPIEVLFVLEAANNDAGRNGELSSKAADPVRRRLPASRKVSELGTWDQKVRGPIISFLLIRRGFSVAVVFDKHFLFSMQKNVGRFVEECEPKMVVSLIAKA